MKRACVLLLVCARRTDGLSLSPGGPPTAPLDVVLSSGFLAFARHAGLIDACCALDVRPARIVGSSSGSLAGSMWASGLTPDQISDELSSRAPIQLVRFGRRMDKGLLSVRGLVAHMRTVLPKDFSQLRTPLAVGVIDSRGVFELISSGDLPEAVAASCAIPYIFQPVLTGDPPQLYADGGVKDRLGLADWARWSDTKTAIVHLVGSSRPGSESEVPRAPDGRRLLCVRTPKADASFLSLKDYEGQRKEARSLTFDALRRQGSSGSGFQY